MDLSKKHIIIQESLRVKAKYQVLLARLLLLLFMLLRTRYPTLAALLKKKDYDAKTSDTEERYFTSPGYNIFKIETIDNQIKEETKILIFLDS